MIEYTLPDGDKTVTFVGEELGAADSRAPGKDRWFELHLYRTEGGNYVVAGAGRTKVRGEDDRCWVKVSESAIGAVESLHQVDDDDVRYLTRVAREALDRACQVDDELCQAYRLQRIR